MTKSAKDCKRYAEDCKRCIFLTLNLTNKTTVNITTSMSMTENDFWRLKWWKYKFTVVLSDENIGLQSS